MSAHQYVWFSVQGSVSDPPCIITWIRIQVRVHLYLDPDPDPRDKKLNKKNAQKVFQYIFHQFYGQSQKIEEEKTKTNLFNPYFADLCGSGSETLDKS